MAHVRARQNYPNSPRRSVQLVKGVRDDAKVRQRGFSKYGKHRDSQVLLALMVTREGFR